MKGKAIIPLVLGLGIGIFAIKMFFNVLNKAKGATSGETVQVVRAKIDIAPTIEITEQMVEIASVPQSLAPKLPIRDLKEAVGRVTSNSIAAGSPVVTSLLAPKGTLPGMAARIPEGYRAIAVKVDESVGVAGWIKPGSRVDVIAVMTGKGGSKNEVVSRVILQNISVLAVGQDIGNSGETTAAVPKSVTLLVTPDDSPKLHLAATKGSLRLAMRNQSDALAARSGTTTDNEILGISSTSSSQVRGNWDWSGFLGKLGKNGHKATDKPVAAAKTQQASLPVEPKWVVEVFNSGRTSKLGFDGSGKDARLVDARPTSAAVPSAAPQDVTEQQAAEQMFGTSEPIPASTP